MKATERSNGAAFSGVCVRIYGMHAGAVCRCVDSSRQQWGDVEVVEDVTERGRLQRLQFVDWE
jgi:hypothetical protein